ncbi:MAG TPA: sigma-54 dependent transcriptional regulator [Deltaproteobacteria bacterium]|jgi:DNA-binding NtrC family response regulator|nr:sigma-54 dependent transcriptional regulator [Deltaproteobacteria bacterium]HQJ08473.1 sigma-54 dependent transcriptional regulator [Deltaproteobacteria bacterium]
MKEVKPEILIVDDEDYTRTFFQNILMDENYTLVFAKNGREALQSWKNECIDLIIMDIMMPEVNGMEVLKNIRSSDTDTMVIMVSAYGDMDSVIDAMRLGANDFFTKPFGSIDKIKLDIRNALDRKRLIKENERLKNQVAERTGKIRMVYSCRSMANVVDLAARASMLDSPVLIQGESGTGKEIIARYIHMNSNRRDEPFFAVNCGALSESLLEPTLFGYEKGAFTGADKTTPGYFEAANGGTIFLDEITETNRSFQVRLLRVLQEGEIMRVGGTKVIKVDFRLISSTNRDLASAVKKGDFRKDLFYRINVIKIDLPPLRERAEDIPLLLDCFMNEICERNSIAPKEFTPAAVSFLQKLHWEGNVREMQNLVERLIVMTRSKVIDVKDFPPEYRLSAGDGDLSGEKILDYEQARISFEKGYIEKLMKHAGSDMKKAARISGLDLSTLYRKKNRLHN